MQIADWGVQTLFGYKQEDPSTKVVWVHPMVLPFFTLFGGTMAGSGGLMHAWVPATTRATSCTR